jgi:hypothetical protein
LMRMLTIAWMLLLTPLLMPLRDAQKAIPNLELRFVPGDMVNGIPQAFTFELINVTGHNVWVADPGVQCINSYYGYFSLRLHFTPLHPPASETGGGCVVDRFGWPPILERVQEWKVLPPGEEIKKTVSLAAMHYEVKKAGTYEFWAEYSPPAAKPTDQQTLRERGIDFPLDPLTTSHLIFKSSQ